MIAAGQMRASFSMRGYHSTFDARWGRFINFRYVGRGEIRAALCEGGLARAWGQAPQPQDARSEPDTIFDYQLDGTLGLFAVVAT
jgi:hypothetical protein